MLSIVTNASLADASRIRWVIPHWLRVFGDRFDELVIVLDTNQVSGRIAQLHGSQPGEPVREVLQAVARLDSRIRVVDLPPSDTSEARQITAKWFRSGHPVRCQAGTPILAFLYAIEQGRAPVVLRADCDMLFFESGWLSEAVELVRDGAVDIVEPPRLGWHEPTRGVDHSESKVTTRTLVLSPRRLAERKLPLVAHRLDPARRLHRKLLGRTTWLALEQMLQKEVARGHLSYQILTEGGFWLHVATGSQMVWAADRGVIGAVEVGTVPPRQADRFDLWTEAWDEPEGLSH